MTRLQIRGEDHPEGPLRLTLREGEDKCILSDGRGNALELGEWLDALLVAKCIEVTASWDLRPVEANRDVEIRAIRETLEMVRENHNLQEKA